MMFMPFEAITFNPTFYYRNGEFFKRFSSAEI